MHAKFQDFSVRAKKYTTKWILIVESAESGEIIGTATIAVDEFYVGGVVHKVGHWFNLRVHPNYRRKGVAKFLNEERRKREKEAGCSLDYATIGATNLASFSSGNYDFRFVFWVYLWQCGTLSKMELVLPREFDIKPITTGDSVSLYTSIYGSRNLFPKDVSQRIAHPNCKGTYGIFDKNGNIVGAGSLWDQSKYFTWSITIDGIEQETLSQTVAFGIYFTENHEHLFPHLVKFFAELEAERNPKILLVLSASPKLVSKELSDLLFLPPNEILFCMHDLREGSNDRSLEKEINCQNSDFWRDAWIY
eukprot:TRINITY_DN9976_c0_g1_i1.p1 TRINITY_DN9976_c0_g1~~TRINITY_DN9976_c0_g1_i1.p1  ORF type:complete len:306 (-),score=41.56 TRINITY_DN9976_c0_g1_i1:1080-1997(-)